ncbi:MAG: hypothetical protein R2697_10605 [Ilumatobacteraceae bacterium]
MRALQVRRAGAEQLGDHLDALLEPAPPPLGVDAELVVVETVAGTERRDVAATRDVGE